MKRPQRTSTLVLGTAALIAVLILLTLAKDGSRKTAPDATAGTVTADATDGQMQAQQEVAAQDEDKEVVADADGWKSYRNKLCGVKYRAPGDWTSQGYLAEGQYVLLVTPEAMKKSEEQLRLHPEYQPEGESGMYDPEVSLEVLCHDGIGALLQDWPMLSQSKALATATDISGLFEDDLGPVKGGDGSLRKLTKVGTVFVGGEPAYEMALTTTVPGKKPSVSYFIFVEKDKVYEIDLFGTSYEKLPQTYKDIIASIELP